MYRLSDNLNNCDVWLVGAGPMAIEYAKVLKHLGVSPVVIGRGKASADYFHNSTNLQVHTGGLSGFLKEHKPNASTYIIIATGTESLMPSLLKFKDHEFGRILIEKPAAISIEELITHENELKPIQRKTFVAYNRRFYPSVKKAIELIKDDGGLVSMHFDFTEWSHRIEPLVKAPRVKENWFFANSTHVIDLAFFIAGSPKRWSAYCRTGSLKWHNKVIFVGSGITQNNVLFTYNSNWESSGRWGIEFSTNKRKLILKPLEKVFSIDKGSINDYEIDIKKKFIDLKFKDGLLGQTKAFLQNPENKNLCKIEDHVKASKNIYKMILEGISNG